MADDIAVVGVGCRVPGADNLEEFWQVLDKGENHVREVRDDRWSFQAVYNPDPNVPGMSCVNKAGLLKGKYEDWDNHLFNVSDHEALYIDPQQRITLECCHMAFEDAGITHRELDGSKTGVYIGSMNDDFKCRYFQEMSDVDSSAVTGVFSTLNSARVSFVYNLQGPSMTIDTACSSSLVAIHLGYQALQTGDCDMAVCGGVNSLSDPKSFIALSKARMLSPTGQSQAFSKDADGYARGEGCGVVILKRLADWYVPNAVRGKTGRWLVHNKMAVMITPCTVWDMARADGNKIWGVIKSGVNQDGHAATPINAPAGSQQLRLLRDMYSKHNIDKEAIQVIEAHGTGTIIGDPTEVNALGEFFTAEASNRDAIQIGSVKSNIGHLEGAAGVVGLIKLLLMMEHKTVVKSLFYTEETGNPKIDFHRYKMKVPTTQHVWIPGKDGLRTGCVNSFGFGGTNAHLAVQTVKKDHKVVLDHGIYIVGLSAPNDESLVETAKGYLKDIEVKTYSMETLSYTSMCKRDHLQSRVSFTAKSQTELTAQVRAFLNGTIQGPHGRCPPQCEVVFVYCGVGTTWTGMCKELLHQQEFRTAVSEVDYLIKPLTGWSILSILEAGQDVADAMVGPLAIFACQIGLAALWMHYGLVPDKILGQSVGEVAAAYTAGCIDLNTAVHVIYHRTKALSTVTGGGMMVVKNCDVRLVDQYCKQSNGNINIAVYNSPVSCTVSGSKGDLADLRQKLENRITNGKLFTSVLNVNCAYHSPQVAAAADAMVKHLVHISGKRGQIPLYSSVTGKVVENGVFGVDSYWKMNVCQPVLFHDAIRSATDPNVHTVFVEIGPSPVLRAHASDIIGNSNNSYNVLPSMTKQNEELTFSQTAASLFSIGIPMSWMKVVSIADEIVPIPKYAFQRSPLIYEAKLPLTKPGVMQLVAESNDFKHLYIMRSKSSRESIVLNISEATSAFIFTHFVNEEIIIPGATYADVGFVIGTKLKGLPLSSVAVSLDFVQAIGIRSGSVNELKVSVHDAGPTVNFTVESGPMVACTGQVTNSKTCSISTVNLHELRLQLPKKIYSQDSYNKLITMGFRYGPQFTLMRNGYSDGKRCLVDIELHPTMMQDLNDLIIHPCILDVMIQTTGNLISDELASTVQNTQMRMLPMAIGSIRVYGKVQRNMVVYTTKVSQISLPTMVKGHYNIALMDIHGDLIAEVENFVMRGKYTGTNTPGELQYVLKWEEVLFSDIGADTHNDKLLVINGSDTFIKPLCTNESTTIATCQLQYDECRHPDAVLSILNRVARQKWNCFEDVTGIIFVCDSDSRLGEPEDVSRIYNMVASNIIGVSGLLKALMDSDFKPPIFVVTECVHEAYITGEKCHVSLVGSELWGYMRNLHVEFMYNNMTIVDISPSLQFAGCYFSHLLRSIESSETVTGTDYAIVRDRIYSPCLVKTSMTEISPTHCIVGQPMAKQYSVKSCSPTDILNIYTTDVDDVDDHYTLPHKTDVLEIATETVCVSNAAFYPKTTTDRDGIHAPWSSGNETGYHVLALEYIGSEFEKCTRHMGKLKKNGDNVKLVACYPTAIDSICRVPKACVVNMAYIPNYQPGLLTAATIYQSVLEYIFPHQYVAILSSNDNSLSTQLCKCILGGKAKQCIVLTENQAYERNNKNRDVIVILSPVTHLSQQLLGLYDKIIFFKSTVTESILNFCTFRANRKIDVIDETQIFIDASLQVNIPKISKWLHKNWPALWKKCCGKFANDMQHTSELSALPCETVHVNGQGGCRLMAKLPLETVFKSSSLYIVVGGLTGLGWEVVNILADLGARIVATINRRPCTPDKQLDIQELERSTGCRIVTLQADVTSFPEIQLCVQFLERSSPEYRIRGVFHGAGVLDSVLLTKITEEQIHKVLKPKIIGAMSLHLATKHCELDFFVVHSSIAAILGSPGQASYGAANSFLDTFINWRRQMGLPGTGINWGALAVGMAAGERVAAELEMRGHMLQSVHELRSCFMHGLLNNKTNIVYTKVNKEKVASDYIAPEMSRLRPMLRFLEDDGSFKVAEKQAGTQRDFELDVYLTSDTDTRLSIMSEMVLSIAQTLVGGDPTSIQMTSTFASIGLDSISSLTLSNVVYNRVSYRIPHDKLLNSDWTLLDASKHVVENVKVDEERIKRRNHTSMATNKLREVSRDAESTTVTITSKISERKSVDIDDDKTSFTSHL